MSKLVRIKLSEVIDAYAAFDRITMMNLPVDTVVKFKKKLGHGEYTVATFTKTITGWDCTYKGEELKQPQNANSFVDGWASMKVRSFIYYKSLFDNYPLAMGTIQSSEQLTHEEFNSGSLLIYL